MNSKLTPYQKFINARDKLYKDLMLVQSKCEHPMSTRHTEHRADDGYGERTLYWKEHQCLTCGLKWIEDAK